MSPLCNCPGLTAEPGKVEEPNCPCDKRVYITPLNIPAGQQTIPRQIATFAQFRNALLAGIRQKPALSGWRARGNGDFGIMLLEMWAYVCDVLSFYDETIAHETYLRTARLRPSLRKLTGLIGYIPSPAVAAFVNLALLAEGRKPVNIPLGTAFRSGAFDAEPPQVFEIDNKTLIHPLHNKWELEKVRPAALGTDNPGSLYLDPKSAKLKEGDIVLVRHESDDTQISNDQTSVCLVDTLSKEETDGEKYTRVQFDSPHQLSADTQLTSIKLLVPKQTASPWTMPHFNSDPYPIDNWVSMDPSAGTSYNSPESLPDALILDGLYRQIKSGQFIILSKDDEYRWFKVEKADEIMMTVSGEQTTEIFKNNVLDSTIVTPPVRTPATRLKFNRGINYTGEPWDNTHTSQIVVYYAFIPGGSVISLPKPVIDEDDTPSLTLSGSIEAPPEEYLSRSFLLQDKNGDGFEVGGAIDFNASRPRISITSGWRHPLVSPVTVFGNVASTTRGESVTGEILGSGDASLANQSFVLKKKPLTYITSPTADDESGVANTLNVYVNRVQWSEVSSFYNISPTDHVYLVRQDDDNNTSVIFGDGECGARLPSGFDNVTADYRFGAGAASPPAGSITQLGKPVTGLKGVKNPVAAAGGDDREPADKIRSCAPGSALLLGRAVSIIDMETAALKVPGVHAVQAQWTWHKPKQCALAQIWYIGEDSIEGKILERLRAISEPTAPISVISAHGLTSKLLIDISVDTRYIKSEVKNNVQAVLTGEEDGMLLPRNIGIGKPLLRSRIFEAVLSVPGVRAVRGITFNEHSFLDYYQSPKSGEYFDFLTGAVEVTTGEGTDE